MICDTSPSPPLQPYYSPLPHYYNTTIHPHYYNHTIHPTTTTILFTSTPIISNPPTSTTKTILSTPPPLLTHYYPPPPPIKLTLLFFSVFISNCRHGVLQYTVIRPLTTIVALLVYPTPYTPFTPHYYSGIVCIPYTP